MLLQGQKTQLVTRDVRLSIPTGREGPHVRVWSSNMSARGDCLESCLSSRSRSGNHAHRSTSNECSGQVLRFANSSQGLLRSASWWHHRFEHGVYRGCIGWVTCVRVSCACSHVALTVGYFGGRVAVVFPLAGEGAERSCRILLLSTARDQVAMTRKYAGAVPFEA